MLIYTSMNTTFGKRKENKEHGKYKRTNEKMKVKIINILQFYNAEFSKHFNIICSF